jgi:DDE superfamily endonuclease
VLVPVKKPCKGDLDTDAKCRSMLLRGLRYQGERGFALLKERWRALQHVTVSPTQIGDIVKAALVLTQIEHKMIA